MAPITSQQTNGGPIQLVPEIQKLFAEIARELDAVKNLMPSAAGLPGPQAFGRFVSRTIRAQVPRGLRQFALGLIPIPGIEMKYGGGTGDCFEEPDVCEVADYHDVRVPDLSEINSPKIANPTAYREALVDGLELLKRTFELVEQSVIAAAGVDAKRKWDLGFHLTHPMGRTLMLFEHTKGTIEGHHSH